MSVPFEKKIKLIDKNINKLNSNTLTLKESLNELKSTTNLLASAQELLLSQHKTISDDSNNFLMNKNLEKYYNDLIKRKKAISELTEKYKLMSESQNNANNEENLDDIDNENNSLLNKEKDNNEGLGYIIDKNETLLEKGNKELENICNDVEEIKNNIYNQGKDVNELEEIVDINEKKTKSGEVIIKDIIYEENCGKLYLVIFNILLFFLIVAIIIFKLR